MKLFFFIFSGLAILLAIIVPCQHDYISYVDQWVKIMAGKNPWIGTNNAYGITYNFFALVNSFHFKLPKIFFVLSYFFAVYLLYHCQKNKFVQRKWIYFILIFNPLLWIFIVYYGSNDSFLASITLISLIAFLQNKHRISAFLLAIGGNFKFVPFLIAPFLFIHNFKLNYKFIGSFIFFSFIIILLGYYLWGNSIAEPIYFGTQRESKIFSVFRFIRGELQPLGFIGVKNLDNYSIYFTLISWLLSLFFFIRYSLPTTLVILFSYASILLFYKVGHPQFYILLLFLTMLSFSSHYCTLQKDKFLILSSIAFWGWIFLFTILYPMTNRFSNQYSVIREIVGGPTFILHLLFCISWIRHGIKNYKIRY